MAAQGQSKELNLCEKCFATVPAGNDFCPECGAPFSDSGVSEGSDQAIYSDLARANLLRMRSEYKQAEDICLSILKRYPNNATANTLLGDIAAERGDLEQAAEWYELSLDIVADSDPVRQKLANVKQRMAEKEAAATAQQIGIPQKSAPIGLYSGLALLAIIVVGFIAFMIGQKNPADGTRNVVENDPVVVNSSTTGEPAIEPDGGSEPPPTAAGRPTEDRVILDAIAQRAPDGSKLVDVQVQPNTGSIVLTFRADTGQNERAIAARLASAALEASPQTQRVMVRGVRNESIVYAATVLRSAVVATTTPEWQAQHANDESAWVNAILSEEWSAGQPPTNPDTPVSNETTTITTGTPPTTTGGGSPGNVTTGSTG